MNMIALVALVVFSASANAQTLPAVSGTASDPAPVVSAPAPDIAQVLASANVPSGPWVGKLTPASLPSVAAYQSFTSAAEAVGIHKDVWSLYKGKNEVLRVGVFVGVYRSFLLAPKNNSMRVLGGNTIMVPGSVLDWALGTKYGDKYLPALKTGILLSYDLTRPSELHALPSFAGPGVSYAFGGVAK